MIELKKFILFVPAEGADKVHLNNLAEFIKPDICMIQTYIGSEIKLIELSPNYFVDKAVDTN